MSMEKPQEGMECRGQEESDAEGGAASWTSKYCWGSAGFKRQGQFSGSKGWSYDRAQRLCKEAS